MIKNERNKCVNLIQTSTQVNSDQMLHFSRCFGATRKPALTFFFSFLMQKAAEMREKIKILQNEIEILRSKVNAKDRLVMLVAD